MKNLLSFEKGDWGQDTGKAPLVPFDGGEAPKKGTQWLPDPLSLAIFVLTHVEGDSEHRARAAAVNASGVLVLTVARKNAVRDLGPHISVVSPGFNLSARSTRLQIIFEGVYTERAKGSNGDYAGEGVLCMVGRAVLPKRNAHGVDPWDWAKNSSQSSFQPSVMADNNILLVLRYPKKLTLTTRAVFGKMKSTSSASAASYFDTVQLISALMSCRSYHFRPEELAAGVGDALPSSDADNGMSYGAKDAYSSRYPCVVLNRYAFSGQVITVLPGWRCNSTTGASCHGIGPFEMDRAEDVDVLAGVRIIMQDLQCLEQQGYGMAGAAGTAMVSVVFRALSPWEDRGTAMSRSGLSGKTLSAEGVWNASTGQACMMACRGTAGRKVCAFRVCLFFPTMMSITRRDTMLGQINGVDATGGVVHPPLLSFRQHMSTPRLWGYYPDNVPYKYNYTKVDQAVELRQSGSPFDLRQIVPPSLPLSYPKGSLSSMADMLTLFFLTVPGLFRQEWNEQERGFSTCSKVPRHYL
ncbi:hypothetical protein ACQ4PT_038752 [Festuca glaucescens]